MSNYIIDISYHNGKVDLSKAKDSISGVVARCSYGWSSGNIDKQWNNNAKQANDLGIPLFAYHFCYARNEYEAKREAYLALQACSKYQVCVIYYDIEYSDYQGSLSNDMYFVMLLKKQVILLEYMQIRTGLKTSLQIMAFLHGRYGLLIMGSTMGIIIGIIRFNTILLEMYYCISSLLMPEKVF